MADKLSLESVTIKNNFDGPHKLIHGGDVFSAREQLGMLENPPEILDFSANINPLGLPEGVKQAIRESAASFDIYPDPLCRELVAGISAQEGVPGKWILCGNGAADLIYRTVYAIRPKKAMVLSPTFAEYEEALRAASCAVVYYPLSEDNAFQVNEGFLNALDDSLDLLFLCNPNNPTGQLMSKELLKRVADRCKQLGIILFLDECFNDFLEEPQEYTLTGHLEEFDHLIILKAFTKIYAMAGLRLGYCMTANGSMLEKIRAAGQPWSVSSPAQAAGIQALQETEYLAEAKKLIREERDYLIPQLRAAGITVISAGANYIFIRDSVQLGKPLHEALFEKGILIRNCNNYHGLMPGYYRICIRKHEDNMRLIQAIKSVKQ